MGNPGASQSVSGWVDEDGEQMLQSAAIWIIHFDNMLHGFYWIPLNIIQSVSPSLGFELKEENR